MAGERASFLLQSDCADDFDVEFLEDKLEIQPGVARYGRFEHILRIATAAAVACTLGWVSWSIVRSPSPAKTSGSPFLSIVGLDGLPERQASARSLLKPVERMHDGNPCDSDEELYGGLCYKKCSLLTQGEAPIRTSSWTCCENHPCSFTNQRGGIGHSLLCTGFDVNGQGGCPHKPGACLLDEELDLGICYKKCSLLTHGKFPYRTAAATCCKTQGLGCLDVFNDKTSSSFNVGGGYGDHDPSTPAEAHPPDESWTESDDSLAITSTPAPSSSRFVLNAHFEPIEHLHDGNVCDDEEELYGGLCYKKCGLLTSGQAPIRTSSWTCCESHPCGLWNQKGSLGHTIICNGYDVAADGACPHKPGACLVNEELVLGVCYEKCSLLTSGAFPYRLTAATCCKARGLGCLNPSNDMTSDSFDTGGGNGDGLDDAQAHLPDESLTEAADSSTHPEPSPRPAGGRHPHEALPRQRTPIHQALDAQRPALRSTHSQLDDFVDSNGELPLGSAIRFPQQAQSKAALEAQQARERESKAALEAKEARDAQAAVAAVIKAMK